MDLFFWAAARASEVGIRILRSGFAKRAVTWLACCETGARARRFRGRLERGSWDVGIDSGMGSDIIVGKPGE